jgi:hypothetical protein
MSFQHNYLCVYDVALNLSLIFVTVGLRTMLAEIKIAAPPLPITGDVLQNAIETALNGCVCSLVRLVDTDIGTVAWFFSMSPSFLCNNTISRSRQDTLNDWLRLNPVSLPTAMLPVRS